MVKSPGLVGAVTAVRLEPGLTGGVVGVLEVVGCMAGLPPAAEDIMSTLVGDTDSVDVDSAARVVLRNSRPPALRGAALPGSGATSRTSTASAVTLSSAGAVPTTILTEARSPTRGHPSEPVATPSQGLPRVILPNSSGGSSTNGRLIQLGFLFPLNYVFVSQHLQAAAQIFEVLPGALAHGTVQRSAIEVARLVPYDKRETAGYITTVAKLSGDDNLCFTLISWLGAVLTPTIAIQNLLSALPDELSANGAAIEGRAFIKLRTLQALIYHYEGGRHFENATEDLWCYVKENSSLPSTSSILDDDWLVIKSISGKLPLPDSNGPHLIFHRVIMLHRMMANRDDLHSYNIQPTLGLPDRYLDLQDEIKYINFCQIYFMIADFPPSDREFNLLDLIKAPLETNRTITNTNWKQWRSAAIAFAQTCPGLWDDHSWLEESDWFLRR
ncbi:hypothetical protein IF1G_10835 [Cordyceps javanica]|uniref:Uncharacterized protein n=1 Tax=Cordyceps javanica TaxID=43265 RepID=A0A545VJI5_9HYPO|nr:hypothetical protein IF1G_10835 [Cordyceps javanica]TQW01891.1 hypothetical protein IF2G_10604 [Cordyceps javanica]